MIDNVEKIGKGVVPAQTKQLDNFGQSRGVDDRRPRRQMPPRGQNSPSGAGIAVGGPQIPGVTQRGLILRAAGEPNGGGGAFQRRRWRQAPAQAGSERTRLSSKVKAAPAQNAASASLETDPAGSAQSGTRGGRGALRGDGSVRIMEKRINQACALCYRQR